MSLGKYVNIDDVNICGEFKLYVWVSNDKLDFYNYHKHRLKAENMDERIKIN